MTRPRHGDVGPRKRFLSPAEQDPRVAPATLMAQNTASGRIGEQSSGIPSLVQQSLLPQTGITTPSKTRSLSDSTPALDPSPKFREDHSRTTRDDNALVTTPSRMPRRVDLSARGLVLQMPQRDIVALNPASAVSASNRGICPPQVEGRECLNTPSTVLPRHSRGMDFSRAATNLHHSTLIDQSSPDSSPTITQKNTMGSSRRQSTVSMMLDSPRLSSGWIWSGSGASDRNMFSRSVGSNAVTSDASSSCSEDEEYLARQDDDDDMMLSTPGVRRTESRDAPTPFGMVKPSDSPNNPFAGFRQHQRNLKTGRRLSSASSGTARMASPEAMRFPGDGRNPLFWSQDVTLSRPDSRRESLNLGTNQLHITNSESGDDINQIPQGVVRRPVVRRSNLLPKSKNFARIRAALQEEGAPVDSEFKREAEVVKQVRGYDMTFERKRPSTAPSSPSIPPIGLGMQEEESEMFDMELKPGSDPFVKPTPDPFRSSGYREVRSNIINSNGNSSLYNRKSTPPPPLNFHRGRSSSTMSEDVADVLRALTPASSIPTATSCVATPEWRPGSSKMESDGPQPAVFQVPGLPSSSDVPRRINKRRRDDDFDIASIKRRAVSPATSVSSPILGQSPNASCCGWFSQGKVNREGSSGSMTDDRGSNQGGQVPGAQSGGGQKRIGLQTGMTDTNDGLMKMSID